MVLPHSHLKKIWVSSYPWLLGSYGTGKIHRITWCIYATWTDMGQLDEYDSFKDLGNDTPSPEV